MLYFKTQNPNELVGKIVKLVCDEEIVFEDVICSVGCLSTDKIQLNFSITQLVLEEVEE